MYKYVLLLETIIQKHSHHSISKSSEFTAILEKLKWYQEILWSTDYLSTWFRNSSFICRTPQDKQCSNLLLNAYQPKRLIPGYRWIKLHLKRPSLGRRDGSVVKSTDCSSKGPEFKFQQPHGGSQPSVMRSDALFRCVWGQLQCTL